MNQINDEVFVADEGIVRINRAQIHVLKEQAARNARRRVRICAHKDLQDCVHEMLIVLAKEAYIRPHKHFNKSESFHVIEGSALLIFFNDDGDVAEVHRVGDFYSGVPFYFRNDSARYHCQIIISDYLVFHETTNGPFNRADTIFAPWAPEESDALAAEAFMQKLALDAAEMVRAS